MLLLLVGCFPSATDLGPDGSTDTTPADSGTVVTDPEADDARVRALTDLPEGDAPCREPVLVRVSFTVDGDTFYARAEEDDEQLNVRMIGVDTPEVSHEGEPAECFANEAWTFSAEALEERLAWLTFDAECTDAYDRSLAYVIRGEGASGFHNRVLARGGYADELTIAPNDTWADAIADDVREARSEGKGLWGACDGR